MSSRTPKRVVRVAVLVDVAAELAAETRVAFDEEAELETCVVPLSASGSWYLPADVSKFWPLPFGVTVVSGTQVGSPFAGSLSAADVFVVQS